MHIQKTGRLAGRTVEATFRIVTPMFLGGADNQPDGIRPPSIKGALRFWWRALNWGRFRMECEGDSNPNRKALQKLHTKEAHLFGAAADEESGGQGVFLLRVRSPQIMEQDPPAAERNGGEDYLRGRGLKGRKCLPAGREFTISLLFRPARKREDAASDRASVIQAVKAFGLLGGLGSRARRGCGSVAMLSLQGAQEEWRAPETLEEYDASVRKLMQQEHLLSGRPPFTAFFNGAMLWYGPRADGKWSLPESVGRALIQYRSNGLAGPSGVRKILTEQIKVEASKLKFWSDHDLMLKAARGRPIDELPKRLAFGMPHNYRFSDGSESKLQDTKQGRMRRASPLLIHFHEIGMGANRTQVCQQLLMQSVFLPENETIEINRKEVPVNIQWREAFEGWFTASRILTGGICEKKS